MPGSRMVSASAFIDALTDGTLSAGRPRFSPDGRRIVYGNVAQGRHGATYVLDVRTGETSKVADGVWAEWLDDHTLIVNRT